MTGRLAAGSGVHTLTVSQPPAESVTASVPSRPDCGGGGPYDRASRVPSHPSTGPGAANRAGGSANGMPLKTATPDSSRPRRPPAVTRTLGSVAAITVCPSRRYVEHRGSLRARLATANEFPSSCLRPWADGPGGSEIASGRDRAPALPGGRAADRRAGAAAGPRAAGRAAGRRAWADLAADRPDRRRRAERPPRRLEPARLRVLAGGAGRRPG